MKTTSKRIRQITDGAIIVALYCVFLLISRLTGTLLEYDLFFIMPIPVAMYAYKYDFKVGFIPAISTLLVSFFITSNPLNALVYVLPALLIGLTFGGFLIKKDLKAIYIILIIAVIAFISEILSSIILSSILGIENIFEEIKTLISMLEEWLPKININNVNIPLLEAIMEGLIPSILILVSLVDSVLIYLVFMMIVLRSKLFNNKEKLPYFKFLSAPKWLSIIYLISIPLMIVSFAYFEVENGIIHVLCVIAINLCVILTMVYLYFGIKISALYLRAIKKLWGIIIIYLCAFIFPLQIIVSLLGVADSFFLLHERILKKYYTVPNENE